MPPSPRPIPAFAAQTPQEPRPYGRWGEALSERFHEAARGLKSDEDLGEPGDVLWFPDRTWGGRTYVPATAPTSDGFELFGYVSYTREHEGAQAEAFTAAVDYTDETAEANPDWRLDLSDQEVGDWRGPDGQRGVITLVWGVSLVANGARSPRPSSDPRPPTSACWWTTASRSSRWTTTSATCSRSACSARRARAGARVAVRRGIALRFLARPR